jgi:hypothetical protein
MGMIPQQMRVEVREEDLVVGVVEVEEVEEVNIVFSHKVYEINNSICSLNLHLPYLNQEYKIFPKYLEPLQQYRSWKDNM